MIVLPMLQTAEALGQSLAGLFSQWFPGEAPPAWWVELALWRAYQTLFGPGGRVRMGHEMAALRQCVCAAAGAKTTLQQQQLYPFPDLTTDTPSAMDRKKKAFAQKMQMWAMAFGATPPDQGAKPGDKAGKRA